jgi:hypothetical protein
MAVAHRQVASMEPDLAGAAGDAGGSGPRGMGVSAYATWCIVIAATIADLGIGTVLQRFVPNLRAAGEHDEPGRMSSRVNKRPRSPSRAPTARHDCRGNADATRGIASSFAFKWSASRNASATMVSVGFCVTARDKD